MNHYAKSIDILHKTTDDSVMKRLLFEVAKINPSALCKAWDSINKIGEPYWIRQAKNIYPGRGEEVGNKIEAIRFVRAQTNCGLKEAKDFIEDGYINPEKYGIKY